MHQVSRDKIKVSNINTNSKLPATYSEMRNAIAWQVVLAVLDTGTDLLAQPLLESKHPPNQGVDQYL